MVSDFWDEHGKGFNPNQHPTGFNPNQHATGFIPPGSLFNL